MSSLSGKVAVVTGGSRGIGFAIARQLIALGARVAIAGTREETVSGAARELGSDALGIRADVRRYDDVERLISATVDRFGGLDILVNSAGVGAFTPVADMSLDEWQRVLDTNLTGVFHCCKAALPHLRSRGAGWIISISSLAGKNPFPNGAAYCASKAALNAFSEALMQEVRQDSVRVAYVLPGSVRTGFSGRTPTAKDDWKLAPEDVAQVVCDLLAHPGRSLPSRVEIRPAMPPAKG
jgi:NAD(P)-dependent dehydrogenase (short-subunit alcohol dehydrogenase family)